MPDAPDTFTSEEGWRLDGDQAALVGEAVARLKRIGCRAILFVDPDPAAVERAATAGADGVEIYTGGYGAAFARGEPEELLERCAATARRAGRPGSRWSMPDTTSTSTTFPRLVAALPNLHEASIGHELTADALEMGWSAAVAAYARALGGPP